MDSTNQVFKRPIRSICNSIYRRRNLNNDPSPLKNSENLHKNHKTKEQNSCSSNLEAISENERKCQSHGSEIGSEKGSEKQCISICNSIKGLTHHKKGKILSPDERNKNDLDFQNKLSIKAKIQQLKDADDGEQFIVIPVNTSSIKDNHLDKEELIAQILTESSIQTSYFRKMAIVEPKSTDSILNKKSKMIISQKNEALFENNERSEAKTNKCPYCEYRYSCPRFLLPHMKEKHTSLFKEEGRKTFYKCLYCEKWCSRPRIAVTHMHRLHPEMFSSDTLKKTNKFECTQSGCLQVFASERKLNRHLCTNHYITENINLSHRKRSYNKERLSRRVEKVASGEIVPWGEKSLSKKHRASEVTSQHHRSSRIKDCYPDCWAIAEQNGQYMCNYCQKPFRQHSVCVNHEAAHEIKEAMSDTKELPCDECAEVLTGKHEMSKHQHTAHNKKTSSSHQCFECGKLFSHAGYVKQHLETVHQRKSKFTCEVCNLSYRQRSSLAFHRLKNHGTPGTHAKTHTCKLCNAVFKSNQGYRCHMYKHSGLTPYSCRFCSRKFFSSSHQRAHEYIHTGGKKHKCLVCDKSFTNQGTLYNHLYKYAVHGTLPKIRKFDDGSSLKAFKQAVKNLETSGGLKNHKSSLRGFAKKTKVSNKRQMGGKGVCGSNQALDTLARVAGMINGFSINERLENEEQSLSQNLGNGDCLSSHVESIHKAVSVENCSVLIQKPNIIEEVAPNIEACSDVVPTEDNQIFVIVDSNNQELSLQSSEAIDTDVKIDCIVLNVEHNVDITGILKSHTNEKGNSLCIKKHPENSLVEENQEQYVLNGENVVIQECTVFDNSLYANMEETALLGNDSITPTSNEIIDT